MEFNEKTLTTSLAFNVLLCSICSRVKGNARRYVLCKYQEGKVGSKSCLIFPELLNVLFHKRDSRLCVSIRYRRMWEAVSTQAEYFIALTSLIEAI